MRDLTSERVESRLRQMAELSRAHLDSPAGREEAARALQAAQCSAVVDLSAAAIDARLRAVAGLRRLCLELARAVPC